MYLLLADNIKQHLEYMFAGTGAKNRMSLFLEKSDIKFQPTTERNLVGMIADISADKTR